jgi:hypothetical protein
LCVTSSTNPLMTRGPVATSFCDKSPVQQGASSWWRRLQWRKVQQSYGKRSITLVLCSLLNDSWAKHSYSDFRAHSYIASWFCFLLQPLFSLLFILRTIWLSLKSRGDFTSLILVHGWWRGSSTSQPFYAFALILLGQTRVVDATRKKISFVNLWISGCITLHHVSRLHRIGMHSTTLVLRTLRYNVLLFRPKILLQRSLKWDI